MSKTMDKNWECVKKILDKYGYEIESAGSPDAYETICASKEVGLRSGYNDGYTSYVGEAVNFYVMVEIPYERFEQWKETSEISKDEAKERINELNHSLEECVKGSNK